MIKIYTDASVAVPIGKAVTTCFVLSSSNFIGYNTVEYDMLNSSLQGELCGIRDGLNYLKDRLRTKDKVVLYCDSQEAINLVNGIHIAVEKTDRDIVKEIQALLKDVDVKLVLIRGHRKDHNPNKVVDLISNSVLRLSLKRR